MLNYQRVYIYMPQPSQTWGIIATLTLFFAAQKGMVRHRCEPLGWSWTLSLEWLHGFLENGKTMKNNEKHSFHSPDCFWAGTVPWNHWKCKRTIFWQRAAATFAVFGGEEIFTVTNSQLMGPSVDFVWSMMEVEESGGELRSGVLFSRSTVVYMKEWDYVKRIWPWKTPSTKVQVQEVWGITPKECIGGRTPS